MQRLCLIVAIATLLNASAICAQNADLPGGIVYSDGRDIFYQSLKTGQNTNLTADFSLMCSNPVAISQDLTIMAWPVRSGLKTNIYIRYLPDGKPKNLCQASGPQLESLSISPESEFVSFSTTSGYSEVVPIKTRSYFNKRIPSIVLNGMHFPTWAREKNSLTTAEDCLKVLQKHLGEKDIVEGLDKINYKEHPLIDRLYSYGRISEKNIALSTARIWNKQKSSIPLLFQGSSTSFLTLCPGNDGAQKLITIFRHDAQKKWGPIGFQYWRIGLTDGTIDGRDWTLPLQTKFHGSGKDFTGFSIKSDGSITYLADKNLYSESGKILASDISGKNLVWISSSSFLFLGENGGIYLCQPPQKPEKVLNFNRDSFSYCSDSPARTQGKTATFWKGEIIIGDFPLRQTRSHHNSVGQYFANNPKNPILTEKETKEYLDRSYYRFRHSKGVNQISISTNSNFGHCLTDKTDIKDIEDPSVYEYSMEAKSFHSLITDRRVVLLKKGKKYLAVQIIADHASQIPVGKYFNPKGAFKNEQGKRFLFFLVPPTTPDLTYNWKYWANSPNPKTP